MTLYNPIYAMLFSITIRGFFSPNVSEAAPCFDQGFRTSSKAAELRRDVMSGRESGQGQVHHCYFNDEETPRRNMVRQYQKFQDVFAILLIGKIHHGLNQGTMEWLPSGNVNITIW